MAELTFGGYPANDPRNNVGRGIIGKKLSQLKDKLVGGATPIGSIETERNIIPERPFIDRSEPTPKSQIIGAISDRLHNFFQPGSPAYDQPDITPAATPSATASAPEAPAVRQPQAVAAPVDHTGQPMKFGEPRTFNPPKKTSAAPQQQTTSAPAEQTATTTPVVTAPAAIPSAGYAEISGEPDTRIEAGPPVTAPEIASPVVGQAEMPASTIGYGDGIDYFNRSGQMVGTTRNKINSKSTLGDIAIAKLNSKLALNDAQINQANAAANSLNTHSQIAQVGAPFDNQLKSAQAFGAYSSGNHMNAVTKNLIEMEPYEKALREAQAKNYIDMGTYHIGMLGILDKKLQMAKELHDFQMKNTKGTLTMPDYNLQVKLLEDITKNAQEITSTGGKLSPDQQKLLDAVPAMRVNIFKHAQKLINSPNTGNSYAQQISGLEG